LLFDEFWDEDGDRYGRAVEDQNSYTTGRIGKYNVVLALLPQMGKVTAASSTASIRSSYTCLRLALLVGICGGFQKRPKERSTSYLATSSGSMDVAAL
jgi:nucleoside phosphorylase